MKKSWMLGGVLLTSAVLGTAVEVQFYDESLPITLNPLFATTMVDNRAHELYFDRFLVLCMGGCRAPEKPEY